MSALDQMTEAFRNFVNAEGLLIFQEQSINHGYQFTITDSTIRIPISFYTTGRIVVQGKDSALRTRLSEWANLQQAGVNQPKPTAILESSISRNSRYTVTPAKFQSIREDVIECFPAIISVRPVAQEAEVYRIELQRGTDRVTVTQFQTGTLFVQGRSSQLFDELCDALDRRLVQSFADRAVRFLPEETANTARPYLESVSVENDAWAWVQRELRQPVCDFLWSHDQQTIVSGAGILLALQETNRKLAEFSPVVMPFGKAFEGFCTKLAIHLGLVTQDAIAESAAAIKIGAWISNIHEQLPDQRRYEFVTAALNSAWQSRNKCMHADPQVPMPIRSIDEAKVEISSIIRGMVRAHDVFVANGIRLKPKEKAASDSGDAASESKPTNRENSNQNSSRPLLNQFKDADVDRLVKQLELDGHSIEYYKPGQRTIWTAKIDSVQVFCSRERLVTVRGGDTEAFIARYQAFLQPMPAASLTSLTLPVIESKSAVPTGWIGVDESGKGDVFGPLVIAGVFIQADQEEALIRIGVRDSKTLSDSAITRLSSEIITLCPHHTVMVVEPLDYNKLYERLQNLNLLLAHMHADVIVQLHTTTGASRAISDQFGDERLVRNALGDRAGELQLVQRPHAEEDTAVAAASILARAAFVAWLAHASDVLGFQLPPGVAPVTIEAGRLLFKKQGKVGLARHAKLHFRTIRAMV